MSKFQLVTILIILAVVFVAFLILSGVIPGLPGMSSGQVVNLTIWGTLPEEQIAGSVNLLNENNKDLFVVQYVEKDPANYEIELVNALASDSGPDIWFLTQDLILKHRDKIFVIPFESFKERDFKNLFVDSAELFLLNDPDGAGEGIIGVPLLVDPIILYWNKDLFNKAGLASPPKDWNQFLSYSQLLTEKEQFTGNINQSGAAMGEFSNINNAKEILSLLILQGGNNIIDPENLQVVLGEKGAMVIDPATSALTFYLNFSNPAKVSYSWNRGLPDSKSMFLSGKLAMYFGYASEYKNIKERNPHLNFDIVTVPQIDKAGFEATFGRIYSLVISKKDSNAGSAAAAAFAFADGGILNRLQTDTLLPSSRRDLLSEKPKGVVLPVFFKAALQSRSWLESDPIAVSNIFKDMVESSVIGRKRISQAISDAKSLLQAEMQKIK